jgi:hypothetical protein
VSLKLLLTTCSIEVLLNGKTATIPLQFSTNSDTSLSFDGVMNLENWDALAAVASINKACEALLATVSVKHGVK